MLGFSFTLLELANQFKLQITDSQNWKVNLNEAPNIRASFYVRFGFHNPLLVVLTDLCYEPISVGQRSL